MEPAAIDEDDSGAASANAGAVVRESSVAEDTRMPERVVGPMHIHSDSEIIVNGEPHDSWEEVIASGYFHQDGARCGIDRMMMPIGGDMQAAGGGSDCTFGMTNVRPQYDPSAAKLRIPVVVHVIQSANGTGFISESRVRSQIEILNEDFQAIPGTNGANGEDARLEFYLATQDPSGNPTDGITYTTNTTWFNDFGSYYNELAWDTSRYLNIYTNSASGALGYVPGLPQSGIAGSPVDRVVCLYSAFGRDAPLTPFDLGRTATHEVGHYLGLFHVFDGGCSSGDCNLTGDLICDTNAVGNPTFGCPSSRFGCGGPSPFDNYMDYSDDICMERFTAEQINRMRCSLVNYRPDLYEVILGVPFIADFEDGIDGLFRWDIIDGVASFSSDGAPGQERSARFTAASELRSFLGDLSGLSDNAGVEVIAEASGADAGDLLIELQNRQGVFVEVLRINPTQALDFATFGEAFPPESRVRETRVRVRLSGASGGSWLLEQMSFGNEVDAEPGPCAPSDLAQPFGLLDGADVNAFISAFGISGSLADLNNDGTVDGADVNAFISAFGAGCP